VAADHPGEGVAGSSRQETTMPIDYSPTETDLRTQAAIRARTVQVALCLLATAKSPIQAEVAREKAVVAIVRLGEGLDALTVQAARDREVTDYLDPLGWAMEQFHMIRSGPMMGEKVLTGWAIDWGRFAVTLTPGLEQNLDSLLAVACLVLETLGRPANAGALREAGAFLYQVLPAVRDEVRPLLQDPEKAGLASLTLDALAALWRADSRPT
jgi:hypothetical protein